MSVLRRATAVVLLVMLTASCARGSDVPAGIPGDRIERLPADLLPATVLGLATASEDVSSSLAEVKRSYDEAVGVYSFRSGDTLQATLQVNRFSDEADYTSERFQSTAVAQIGGSRPRKILVGKDVVYLTRGTKQQIAVWFRGRNLFILSMREEYPEQRNLLRAAVEVQL